MDFNPKMSMITSHAIGLNTPFKVRNFQIKFKKQRLNYRLFYKKTT